MANTGNIATISGNVLTDSAIDLSTKADLVGGLVPSSQLPSYVDDVLEYATLAGFPATGEAGKIYVDLATNETYRWSGSAYVRIANGAVQSFNTRTGIITLSSTDVTTALGFTPYNATNPSGYLTTSTVLNTVLTPYAVGANTAVTATDTIETAIEKLQGQLNNKQASGSYLTGNQSITVSGDATGSGTTAIALTLANSGVSAGTYTKVTVDAKGRVTVGASLAVSDIPTLSLENIPDAWVKRSVKAATTANITLSAPQTVDGVTLVAGDRVLVKDQTTGSENGIYIVASGAWTRSTDADNISELAGAVINVDAGTVNGGFRFDTDLKTTDTLGTTSIVFAKILDLNDTATANTASKVVVRDGSGNFSAGTITAALTGNALTASTLQTARTLTIGSTGKTFNGSANVAWTLAEIGAQASATNLTSLAALTYVSASFVKMTAAGTFALDTTTYVPTTRTLTINGTALDLSADRSWTIASASSIATLTDVTLTSVADGQQLKYNSATSKWINFSPPSAASVRIENTFTATAAQATFTIPGGYTAGLVDVFVNGARFDPSDFTATNGTTVVLGAGLLAGDLVSIVCYTAALGSVAGSGTVNTIPKFTAGSTLGNSGITDNGTTVTLVSRALSGTSATFSGNITAGGIIATSGTGGTYGLLDVQSTAATSYASMSLRGNSRGGEIDFYDGTNAGAAIVGGTSTDKSLYFYTNGITAVAMAIKASGYVSIFSNSPNAPLDVTSATSGSSSIQQWSYNTSPGSYRLQLNTIVSSGLVKYSFDMLNAGASYNNVLVFDKGNLGIGTATPGTWKTQIISASDGVNITSSGASQALNLQSATNNQTILRINNFNGNFFDIQNNPATNSLTFDYNDTVRLAIQSDGAVVSGRSLGNNYTQTSGASTGTSIVDTGITYNTGDYGGFNRGATYMVVFNGNPNAGGSGAYFAQYAGIIMVYTGWSGSALTTYINYTQLATGNNISALTLSAVFWNGSAESTSIGYSVTGAQIRIKIAGYNSAYTGQDQSVYLKRLS